MPRLASEGTEELRIRKCVSIADRHELTAEFAPVRSGPCFLNSCQKTRVRRARWIIGCPRVRDGRVTLYQYMLSFVLSIRTSKVNSILVYFSAKGEWPESSRIPRSMASSS